MNVREPDISHTTYWQDICLKEGSWACAKLCLLFLFPIVALSLPNLCQVREGLISVTYLEIFFWCVWD